MTICCKTRRTPALILAVLSIMVFLCGIIIFVMAASMTINDNTNVNHVDGSGVIGQVESLGTSLLFACGVAALIVGIMGMAAMKIKSKCYIVCYGCSLGCVWLIVFVVGALISFAARSTVFLEATVCAVNKNATNYASYGGIDQPFNNVINNFMCTFQCPCPADSSQVFLSYNETYMNFYNRSKEVGTGQTAAGYTKLYFAPPESDRFYNTFQDCWNQSLSQDQGVYTYMTILNKNNSNVPLARQQRAMKAKDRGMEAYIKSMKYLEQRYFCSGICIQPVFWYTRPINSSPQYGCLNHMVTEIDDKLSPIGTAAMAAGVVMLLIWFFQYCLWCSYKDQDATE